MFCDYHVHTNISADCMTSAEQQCRAAGVAGMREICFTEHLEHAFHRGKAWHCDLRAYQEQIDRLRKEPPEGLIIKMGIEAGVACEDKYFPELRGDLASWPFDFVLVGLHGIDGSDPYQMSYYEGKKVREIYSEYIRRLIYGMEMLGHHRYSAVAHIDFPAKGMSALGMGQAMMRYADASDELDAIFKIIIENGKCIELNTSTYRDIPQNVPVECDWLKRYVELGGEYVTFGSDAHKPGQVAMRFSGMVNVAKEAGIKYFATFDRMKPAFHKL